MRQYLNLMKKIRNEGIPKGDRTGTGTYSLFGQQMRFDLSQGFPLLTTKTVNLQGIIEELLWFLRGETNINTLNAKIWDEWADENGDLGPIYGAQWRSWPCTDGRQVDQLMEVIERIRTNPDDRRLLVSAWNVGELDKMGLPPCHVLFQFYVADGRLSCHLYQRSADMFLGVPFNIASYSLLTLIGAQMTGLEPGEFVWTGGDCHIYFNHIDQVDLQLSREPKALPRMKILCDPREDPAAYELGDFQLEGYDPEPAIYAPVAV